MPNDIDKSLLDRLQALRGASEPPESSPKISVDTIERAKTPTREDALAARLKSLRGNDEAPQQSQARPSSAQTHSKAPAAAARQQSVTTAEDKPRVEDVDEAFQTDDKTLEDLLADVGGDESTFATVGEPEEAKVKALLQQLADAIPQDEMDPKKQGDDRDDKEEESADDDSDGEKMGKEVDDVIARFRDEVEMDRARDHEDEKGDPRSGEADDDGTSRQDEDASDAADILDLPSVPSDPASSLPSVPSDIDSLTNRLAALRAPSHDTSLELPSVPTTKPSKAPNRLTSRTNYTDEDADSWCTVCLEDATLRCLGCDDDVYCTRCWREMHVGERAGYDERGHKAVQFTRDKKTERRKVAVGAS